jgi:hypothetical protein
VDLHRIEHTTDQQKQYNQQTQCASTTSFSAVRWPLDRRAVDLHRNEHTTDAPFAKAVCLYHVIQRSALAAGQARSGTAQADAARRHALLGRRSVHGCARAELKCHLDDARIHWLLRNVSQGARHKHFDV